MIGVLWLGCPEIVSEKLPGLHSIPSQSKTDQGYRAIYHKHKKTGIGCPKWYFIQITRYINPYRIRNGGIELLSRPNSNRGMLFRLFRNCFKSRPKRAQINSLKRLVVRYFLSFNFTPVNRNFRPKFGDLSRETKSAKCSRWMGLLVQNKWKLLSERVAKSH